MSFITGITGFAGGWLARHLVEGGESVAGLALGTNHRADLPAGVRRFESDIRDRDRIVEALREVRPATIYHLAALSHIGRSWTHRRDTLDVNVVGTGMVLEAISMAAPEARVMLVSSGQVYGNVGPEAMPLREELPLRPVSPYGASKVCCETLARQAVDGVGLRVAIARPFNFAGPGQQSSFVCSAFARQVARVEARLDEPIIRVGNLEAKRDFSDVRDMVAGFAAVAARGGAGRAYNLSSGRGVAIEAILGELLNLARCDIAVQADPARFRPSDVPLFVGDATRAREELGWETRIPLRTTLQDTLEFWRRSTETGR